MLIDFKKSFQSIVSHKCRKIVENKTKYKNCKSETPPQGLIRIMNWLEELPALANYKMMLSLRRYCYQAIRILVGQDFRSIVYLEKVILKAQPVRNLTWYCIFKETVYLLKYLFNQVKRMPMAEIHVSYYSNLEMSELLKIDSWV